MSLVGRATLPRSIHGRWGGSTSGEGRGWLTMRMSPTVVPSSGAATRMKALMLPRCCRRSCRNTVTITDVRCVNGSDAETSHTRVILHSEQKTPIILNRLSDSADIFPYMCQKIALFHSAPVDHQVFVSPRLILPNTRRHTAARWLHK